MAAPAPLLAQGEQPVDPVAEARKVADFSGKPKPHQGMKEGAFFPLGQEQSFFGPQRWKDRGSDGGFRLASRRPVAATRQDMR